MTATPITNYPILSSYYFNRSHHRSMLFKSQIATLLLISYHTCSCLVWRLAICIVHLTFSHLSQPNFNPIWSWCDHIIEWNPISALFGADIIVNYPSSIDYFLRFINLFFCDTWLCYWNPWIITILLKFNFLFIFYFYLLFY